MSTTGRKTRIIISGAGVAGSTLALTILTHPQLRARFSPVLVESHPGPDRESSSTAGAAFVLSCNSLHSLYALGLRDGLCSISQEVLGNEIWRIDPSSPSAPGVFLNRLVSPAWAKDVETGLRGIERGALQRLLVTRYTEAGGEVRWSQRVVSATQTEAGVEVELQGGEKLAGDLVVGADGTWSAVRRSMLDDARWKPPFQHSSGIYGVSPRLECDLPDEEITGRGHVMFTAGGLASTWPLPDGRQMFTVQVNEATPPPARSETVDAPTDSSYKASFTTGGYELASAIENLDRYRDVWHPVAGTYGRMFDQAERIIKTPLYQKVFSESEIQTGGNIALIGDAGRVIVPASGQGANFAVEDATVLADALLNNQPTVTHGKASFRSALEEYARRRVPRSQRLGKESYWKGAIAMGDKWWSWLIRDFLTPRIKMDGDVKKLQLQGQEVDLGWEYRERFDVKERTAEIQE